MKTFLAIVLNPIYTKKCDLLKSEIKWHVYWIMFKLIKDELLYTFISIHEDQNI